MIDLHVHSVYSVGGHDLPDTIFQTARDRGLRAVCLTEHDTVDSVGAAAEAAAKHGVATMPGMEFFTDISAVGGTHIHVLAYFFDPGSDALRHLLAQMQQRIRRRTLRLVAEVNRLGVPMRETHMRETQRASYPEAVGLGIQGTHDPMGLAREAARTLCRRQGWNADTVASLMKSSIPHTPVADVVRAVRAAGGITFWAHPVFFKQGPDGRATGYGLDGFRSEPLLDSVQDVVREFRRRAGELFDLGIDGYEAMTSKHPREIVRALREEARRQRRPICGGGDCHRAVELGCARVPDEVFARMRTYHAQKNG